MNRLNALIAMTKPRAMVAVLISAAAGYLLGADRPWEFRLLTHLLIGTALSGAGSIVLNQVIERRHDAKMRRTRGRALPTGVIRSGFAWVYGLALSIGGTVWLFAFSGTLTAVLAALCVVSYVAVYTPLKRVSTLNAVIGAVPGAIPPMMGWTAATQAISAEAWVLFLILFVWQFPHFLAIGWLYRDDYRRAGYAMLSMDDTDGWITGRQVLLNSACLMVVTLMPFSMGFAGVPYLLGAVALGLALVAVAGVFLWRRTRASARWLLRATVVHIAVLMALLVTDRMIG